MRLSRVIERRTRGQAAAAAMAAAPPPNPVEQMLGQTTTVLSLPPGLVVDVHDSYLPPAVAYAQQRQRTTQALMATPMTLQSRCFLCCYGDRIVDSGPGGSQLFCNLLNLIQEQLMVKEYREIVRMTVNYIDTVIRPVLAYANPPVELPPVDMPALYEHISTGQHTLNSRLAVMNTARLVEQIMYTLAGAITTKEGGHDLAAARVCLGYVKEHMAIHQVNPQRFAFSGGTATSDLNLDMSRVPLAAASATAHIHRTQNPFVSRFLQDFHRQEAAAAAGAAGAADTTIELDEDENI